METITLHQRNYLSKSLESLVISTIPIWKRVVDIIGAVLALTILSPLFLLAFTIIKVVSPGPVFFKQARIGYLGKPFTMWKFRTMKIGSDITPHQKQIEDEIRKDLVLRKVKNDSRIIPLGKFLRQSCLDEMPQLLNVLKGEMSLVGPRPELPYAVDKFKLWNCERFDVLPGMTGLWQINGKNRTTFRQMILYDIEYCRQLSFWLEMKILFLTIPTIIMEYRK